LAAFLARPSDLEAMAVTSHNDPCWNAGITCFMPILAVLRTPHLTFFIFLDFECLIKSNKKKKSLSFI
jgi:hypothetical protein